MISVRALAIDALRQLSLMAEHVKWQIPSCVAPLLGAFACCARVKQIQQHVDHPTTVNHTLLGQESPSQLAGPAKLWCQRCCLMGQRYDLALSIATALVTAVGKDSETMFAQILQQILTR